MGYEFWPTSSKPAPAAAQTTTPGKVPMRRSASGKMVPVVEPRLDPTLDLNLLSQSEEIKYEGNGRNIFVAGSMPIETPKGNGTIKPSAAAPVAYVAPQPPPP